MPASSAILDMTYAGLKPNGQPEIDAQGRPPHKQGGRPAKLMTPKQIRARSRRRKAVYEKELAEMYKPVEEWDAEELARGRPRAADGSFKGKPPMWMTTAFHEQIIRRFEVIVKEEMNSMTVEALTVLATVLKDNTTDFRGKDRVSPNVKVDVAKFLIEHIIGKPKQRTESEVSVKLEGLLGLAMVQPSQSGSLELTQGYIDADSEEDTGDD